MNATRIEIRLQPEAKELIQRAAEVRNQTLTQFVLTTLAEEAGKVMAEYEQTVLSDRDRDTFLRLLDAPPKPNRALKKAAGEYRKRTAR
jgi:uncharacterized protein (DUF1778 family)